MAIYGYGNHLLFANAASKEDGLIRYKNNVKGLNVDPDTGNVDGGICSGITTTWLIKFLNNVDAGHEVKAFLKDYDATRYQGAYFKELHGKAPDHLAQLDNVLKSNLNEVARKKVRQVAQLQFPSSSEWAAYVSAWGHAIGIGQLNTSYFMMDPNYGLFVYKNKQKFLDDLQAFVEARAARKQRDKSDAVEYIFFDRTL
ncbi:MAG: hypothetical protein F6K31_08440 [Symploca sp. SIO2G7]|nr:hypothetical protein [Symploca sp. SIO2G7]